MKRQEINLNNYQYICEYYKNGVDFNDETCVERFVMLRNFEIYDNIIYDKDIFFFEAEIFEKYLKGKTSTDKIVFPIHDGNKNGTLKFSNLGEMFNYYNISTVKDFIYYIKCDKCDDNKIPCDKIRIYNPTIQKELNYIIHIDNFINDIHFHYFCNLDNNFKKRYEKEYVYGNNRYIEYIEIKIPNIEFLFNEENLVYFIDDFNTIESSNTINEYYRRKYGLPYEYPEEDKDEEYADIIKVKEKTNIIINTIIEENTEEE